MSYNNFWNKIDSKASFLSKSQIIILYLIQKAPEFHFIKGIFVYLFYIVSRVPFNDPCALYFLISIIMVEL